MKSSILTPLLALAVVAPLSGAPLLSENFDNLNTGALNGQGDWTAKTGVSVVDGGLSYSNGAITINGGAKSVQSNVISSSTSDLLANKVFASQSGDVWFSFTLKVDSSTNNSRYWFSVSNTTDLNTGLHGSIADNNTGGKNFYGEIRNVTTGSSTGLTSTDESEVYFLVGRLSKDGITATNTNAYDRMEIWVNPDSIALTSPSALSVDGPSNSSVTGGIENFGLTALSSTATLNWDNLLVGTSQADVLDVYSSSTIPEPSTFAALGGLAALGLAAATRRRRR